MGRSADCVTAGSLPPVAVLALGLRQAQALACALRAPVTASSARSSAVRRQPVFRDVSVAVADIT